MVKTNINMDPFKVTVWSTEYVLLFLKSAPKCLIFLLCWRPIDDLLHFFSYLVRVLSLWHKSHTSFQFEYVIFFRKHNPNYIMNNRQLNMYFESITCLIKVLVALFASEHFLKQQKIAIKCLNLFLNRYVCHRRFIAQQFRIPSKASILDIFISTL